MRWLLLLLLALAGCATSTAERRLALLELRLAELEHPLAVGRMVADISGWVPQQTKLSLLGGLAPADVSGIGGVTLTTSQTISGAKTFSATLTAATILASSYTSSVASGSEAITLTSGQRIQGGNGYWYMDGSGGGRWITLAGLFVAGTSEFAGLATYQSGIDTTTIKNVNSGSNPVSIYDVQGLCVDDGAGAAYVCDGKVAHGLDVSTVQTVTVADNGGGTAATSTLTPASAFVEYTCSDTDGCTVTVSETGAVDGSVVRIVNVSANACTFADTSGVTELTGSVVLGQWDTLTLIYAVDRWAELAASNN